VIKQTEDVYDTARLSVNRKGIGESTAEVMVLILQSDYTMWWKVRLANTELERL
jgi:hypothetical protein